MKPEGLDREFIVVGENLHATRVLLRGGKHVVAAASGEEAIRYTSTAGETRHLIIPEDIKRRQDYQEGRVKHVAVAVRAAMSDHEPAASEGREYLRTLAGRQIKTGSDYLDLNVDEVSLRHHEQVAAMRWLVRFIEGLSPVPLSIDSSNTDTIRAGIDACEGKAGPPLLNSASLERLEALDLAREKGLPVIVTAAGESGMPENTEQRLANASRIVEAALAKGLAVESLHVDALVFPISVDIQFGNHYLEAIRQLRAKFGEKIHLTGGLSNVSFGLPCRRLVNEVFISLAVEAGIDGGIVDSVANDLNHVFLADKTSRPYELARDMLLGLDRNCKNFLRAYRKGEMEPVNQRQSQMVKYQILYWKHLASQVKVFEEGRKPVSRQLPGRLAEIDQLAMEQGLTGTDDYLNHWRWTDRQEREGSAESVADSLVTELMQQGKPT